jgi:hypothetical protein
MMTKKRQSISYGKGQVPKFKSTEAQIKYFEKLAKKQKEEKEKKEGDKCSSK